MPLLVVGCALLGLLVGSFLNVVVHRVPRGESIVRPPSHCPSCDAPVRPRDNVPVLSWLLLRGRCRDCGARISARYPLVEALTAAVFAVLAAAVGFDAALPAFLYLGAIAVALALIDLDVHRLPDVIVLPSYPVLLLLLGVAAAATGRWDDLVRGLIGLCVLWLAYAALRLAYPAGMGYGDVKLAGLLGLCTAWLGWGAFAVGAFSAFVYGSVVGLGLLAVRRAGRKTAIPFGPFMLLGAVTGILAGQPLAEAYLGLLGV